MKMKSRIMRGILLQMNDEGIDYKWEDGLNESMWRRMLTNINKKTSTLIASNDVTLSGHRKVTAVGVPQLGHRGFFLVKEKFL